MGVWAIRHLASGRTLIGWSRHLQGTLNRHRFQLDLGGHPVKALQTDWRRECPEAFAFEILDELAPDPTRPPAYDYAEDLAGLESLWRERLGLTAKMLYGEQP
jgi:hypothetical protein